MAKRNWDKSLFSRHEHVASPSQLVDYLDCPRKWWFRRCLRLPEKADQKKFVFGNVLHDLVQRWLEADDSGRVKGRPVELYPEGWAEGLTPAEAALVKKLFEKGVEKGMLRRLPGRKIEREYVREVVPGVASIGALDIDSPEGVEDQKSTKSARYIATQKALAADPKMLSYAYEWVMDAWAALEAKDPATTAGLSVEEAIPQVKLRLNYFVKDPDAPAVKHVEALVPTQDVLNWWEETCVPAHQGMLDLKRAAIPETDWKKVTGPQCKDTCKKYGGCPRAKICAGLQSVAAHRAEIDRFNKKTNKTKSTPVMSSIFKKKTSSPAASTPVVETVPQAPAEATPPTSTADRGNAPWAHEGCGACKGSGINKQGLPCSACYHIRKRRGEPIVDDFETWHDEAGNLCWRPKDASKAPEAAPAAEAPQNEPKAAEEAPKAPTGKAPVAKEPEAKKVKPPKVVKPKTKPAPAPVIPTGNTEPEAPAEEAQEAAGDPDRDLGFRLFINSMPFGTKFLDASDILAREGAEMAEGLGVASYYDLDAFKRRDLLSSAAADIAAELVGVDVVAIGAGQDIKALVEALRPFAREVVQGVF